MTESETPRDPRAMDDADLAGVPDPPSPPDPSRGSETVVDDDTNQNQASDPDGAEREAPAGEDYAGSGF